MIAVVDSIPSSGTACDSTWTVYFTIYDACGNASEDQFVCVINFHDDTAPTFTVPADMTLTADAACEFDADTAVTGVPTELLDNCDDTLEATWSDVETDGSCAGSVIITRTWTLSDDCGNSTTQVQVITVDDVTPPVVVGPADVTIQCSDDVPAAPETVAEFLLIPGTSVTENCSPVDSLSIVVSTGDLVGTNCEGTITRTYTVFDDCGNSGTAVQVFTVRDTTAPVVIAGVIESCYESIEAAEAAAVAATMASDNCTDGMNLVYTVVSTPGECDTMITVTVTDECDNSASVSYNTLINCQVIRVKVFLEGAYSLTGDTMRTTLNDLEALPGQTSANPLIADWPAGHPYTGAPYNAFPPANTGTAWGDPPLMPYPASVVDWVLVTVRTDTLPDSDIWACAGWVHQDGTVTFPDTCPYPTIDVNQDYYILVQHRNHLGIMSPNFVNIECDGAYIEWDFTTQDSYKPLAFRVGQKEIEPGVWVMYAANGNQTTSITAINSTDHTVWKTLQGLLGYYPSDYNLNVTTNSADESVWKINQNRTTAVIFY
jgi:hypothetical protein